MELRQYTLHPGPRESPIELFERESVTGQQRAGITLGGRLADPAPSVGTRDGGADHGGVTYLGLVTVVVRDYDEAIAFYVDRLGFELLEDTRIDEEKRWVVVAPAGARESGVLLARAVGEGQEARVGDQTGGRVGWFLNTEAFDRDYERLRSAGVLFEEPPRREPYGTVAVFRDLYGNRWDLIQLRRRASGPPG